MENYKEKFTELNKKYEELLKKFEYYTKNMYKPAGHFYSPLPDIDKLKADPNVFERNKILYGINLNTEVQLKYLECIVKYFEEYPFEGLDKEPDPNLIINPTYNKNNGLRYKANNTNYAFSDGIFLFGMLRTLNPNKVIEIGCGFSSCLILDTNELFFDNKIKTIFIEPYPELLYSLIKETDDIEVFKSDLQKIDLDVFKQLEKNDILFIDSTHVSKTDSDVNYLLHTVLPNLKKGVYIHFHDIIYPFEYPERWIYSGFGWNESYILRSFLQYNESFEIVLFNTYLESEYPYKFKDKMEVCNKKKGGSIWLKKVK